MHEIVKLVVCSILNYAEFGDSETPHCDIGAPFELV